MRINEERLLWVRLIVLRVCRHDAQAATGGRTGIRVFLDLAHATADEMLFGTTLERSTHETKRMKMQSVYARRTAMRNKDQNAGGADQYEGRSARLERGGAGRETVSERLTARSSEGWRLVSRHSSILRCPATTGEGQPAHAGYWLSCILMPRI